MRALILALIVTLTPPSQRPGKHLCFVVDVSGSMGGWQIEQAVEAFAAFAGQPIDEAELCVYGFDDRFARCWAEWQPLPNAQAVSGAQAWLDRCHDASNGSYTAVTPALTAALGEDKPELVVVVVSDGLFVETPQQIRDAIAAAQAKRRTRAQIGVIGVHSPGAPNFRLRVIEDGAGYFAYSREDED